MNLEQTLNEITGKLYGKNIGACTDAQLYTGVLQLTKEKMAETPAITGDKKVYYISMEFLIGKLLSNNLINLGIYEELSDILKKNGKNLVDIEEAEPEPSLQTGSLLPGFHRYPGTSRGRYRSELPLRIVQAGIQGSPAERREE